MNTASTKSNETPTETLKLDWRTMVNSPPFNELKWRYIGKGHGKISNSWVSNDPLPEHLVTKDV